MPKRKKAQDAGDAPKPSKAAEEVPQVSKPKAKSARKTEYKHSELPPQPPQESSDHLDPRVFKEGDVVVMTGPDEGHKIVLCHVEGCRNERVVQNQEAFQVKRCQSCRDLYIRLKRADASKRRREAAKAAKATKTAK